MKMLTVSLLVCALMALAAANDVSTNDEVEADEAAEVTEAPHGTEAPNGTEASAPAVNWFPFQCRSFTFVSTPMTWAAAEKHCQTMGANLASVHSRFENQYLLYLTSQNGITQEAWLGGSDCQKEGGWLWSDGSAFDYDGFDESPNDQCHVLNCLQMNYGVDRHWDDTKCDATRPFFCAKPLPCCPESPCPLPVPSDQ